MRLRQFREHIRDWRTLGALTLCAGAVGAVFCLAPSTTPATANVHTARVDAAATYNGILDSTDGSALTVYALPADTATTPNSAALSTGLPAAGQLPSGTEVHISCYLTAATAVSGPQGQGPGNTDPYWDQVDAASTTLPSAPTGDVDIVPDAFIYTNNPINLTAQPCSGPATTTNGSTHDPSIDQGVTGAKHTTLVAQSAGAPALQPSTALQGGCTLGTIPLDALTCSGPVKYIDTVVTDAAQAQVDPRLLLAILYNESGCHFRHIPHSVACEDFRSHLNGALGIANMHPAAFAQAQAQSQAGTALTGTWQDLANNPGLDIQAEAWYIAYLDQQLPSTWPSAYGENELLAMMYNGGATNLLPVVQGTEDPGPVAQGYLDDVQGNWDYIDQLICRSDAYTCSL